MYTRRCEAREGLIDQKRKRRENVQLNAVLHIAFDDNLIKAFCLVLALYAALPDNNEKRLKLLQFWKTVTIRVMPLGVEKSRTTYSPHTQFQFLDSTTDLQNIHNYFQCRCNAFILNFNRYLGRRINTSGHFRSKQTAAQLLRRLSLTPTIWIVISRHLFAQIFKYGAFVRSLATVTIYFFGEGKVIFHHIEMELYPG